MSRLNEHWRNRLADAVVGRLLLTLAIGFAGGFLFFLLGLPAAWLSGPAVAVAGSSIAGAKLAVPNPVRQAAYIFLGSTMGSTVTPETVSLMGRWPMSLLGLALCVLAMMAISSAYLERVHGFDRPTARLAAVPGALPYVMALAAESQGNQVRIILIQVIRLAALLIFLPGVLSLFGHAPQTMVRDGTHPVRLIEVVALLASGAAGAFILNRLRMPAASLFGSMIGAAFLYATGILSSPVPGWLMLPGFVVIGATAGANFSGISLRTILDTLVAGVGSVVIGAVVALAFSVPVAWLLGLTVAQLWLAYSPGGLEVMTVMAMALGLDPAFVGGHHVVRFLGLGFVIPVWLRMGRSDQGDASDASTPDAQSRARETSADQRQLPKQGEPVDRQKSPSNG